MEKLSFLLTSLAILATTPHALAEGLLLERLQSGNSGFRCEPYDEHGSICTASSAPGAPGLIAMYVGNRTRMPSRVVLHFHGLRGANGVTNEGSAEKMFRKFDLPAQVRRAGPDALLVMPLDKMGTARGLDALASDFSPFMKWFDRKTGAADAKYNVTCHSGGINACQSLLGQKNVVQRLSGITALDPVNLEGSKISEHAWQRALQMNPSLNLRCFSRPGTRIASGICLKIQNAGGQSGTTSTQNHYQVVNEKFSFGFQSNQSTGGPATDLTAP